MSQCESPAVSPRRSGIASLGLLGAGLVVLTAAGLMLHRPGAITLPSLRVTWVFVALMAVASCLYFMAVGLVVRRAMPRGTLWLVLGIAVTLRALVLPSPPFLSSDIFRYVWDGKVQNAGINPYLYVPDDPVLASLRDTAIYPHINRAGYARTAYPPTAELVFRAIAAISPTVLAMKIGMVGFECLGIAGVAGALALAGLPRERVLIYAWNPLTVWAFAGNGHVDAIAIGLIGLALLARATGKRWLTGALLGGATLVKFLPAAMAPAFWHRRDWRMPAAGGMTILALYAWYSGAGTRVLGFLPRYATEEGISQGSGIWLLAGLGHITRLPMIAPEIYLTVAACVLAALCVWVLKDRTEDITAVAGHAAILGAATMVVLSPHYAWYYPWLALPCCIRPLRSVIYMSAAGLLLYVNPLNEHFFWPSLLFIPAGLLALLDLRSGGLTLRPGKGALSWARH